MFSIYLSSQPQQNGSITFGGYDLAQYAKSGLTDKDIFWANVLNQENYWTVSMGQAALKDSKGEIVLAGMKA